MSDNNHNNEEASDEPQAATTSGGTTGSKCFILDGKFFKIVSQIPGGKIEAQCQMCITKKVIICGSYKATSNFKTHLKRQHPEKLTKTNIAVANRREQKCPLDRLICLIMLVQQYHKVKLTPL